MNTKPLQYEIDELILSGSDSDEEIPFAFMGGNDVAGDGDAL